METLGIISEYNPFHNGHKEQLRLLREQFGSKAKIIACMSGNFVQRGEAALLDKWQRARTALACGVNLVLELPTIFSCSSADYFATGAVRTLAATGLPLTLCFGSESGQLLALQALAKLRSNPPLSFTNLLQLELAEGQSYAAAHEKACRTFITTETAKLFFSTTQMEALLRELRQDTFWRGSNNQLATAYLASIEQLTDYKKPAVFTHTRSGSQYLNRELQAGFSSATAVRNSVEQHFPSASQILKTLVTELPTESLAILLEALQKNAVVTKNVLAPLIISRIRSSSTMDLTSFQGWDEGLPERAKRIAASRPDLKMNSESIMPATLLNELIEKTSSRRFPVARVQRAFICLLLGIKKNEVTELLDAGAPFYIRVLAADKDGLYLLKKMRKSATLPIISKTSDYLEIPATQPHARRMAEIDLCAADTYSLLQSSYPASDFDKAILLG